MTIAREVGGEAPGAHPVADMHPFTTDSTRRQFLLTTAGAAAGMALAHPLLASALRTPDGRDPDAWRTPPGTIDPTLDQVKPAAKKLKLLVLGGTAFLGPHAVEYALARGHEVTLFNRGKTNPHLFPKLEKLRGDRNDNVKAIEDAVSAGRRWDGVIDTSGYFPRHMDLSCGALKGAADQYLFVASINVYKSDVVAGEDESGELNLELVNGGEEKDLRNYGAYKALCERRAEEIMPGRVTCVRPALISGPRDPSDRFSYWPVRFMNAKGDRTRVVAPSPADQPVQFIDVRDLARFVVTLIENKSTGAFNGIGPVSPITMGELLAACQAAAGTTPEVVWMEPEFLAQQGVTPWSDLPVWVPAEGPYKGIHRRSTAKSAAAGLVTRPAIDTARDTMRWWPGEIERRVRRTEELLEQAKKDGQDITMPDPRIARTGLNAERETKVLKAWDERKG